ncbi:MAG TPA: hypothetical protein VME41_02090 [Stellaceae bacterium]|nr:hypothetical protein [Stellaceae bacterium]
MAAWRRAGVAMRLNGIGIVLIVLAGLVAAAAPAPAASPGALCRRVGTSDRLRPLPPSLTGRAGELFGIEAMPAAQIRRSTFLRCMEGHVLLCNTGANLPCGKANTGRDLPAAEQWCASHPDSEFIPMYVTGHDTVYRWRCSGGKAATVGPPWPVDQRGFITRFWKRAD